MNTIRLTLCALSLLLLNLGRPVAARAQSNIIPPPFASDYRGEVVWHSPDGATQRGEFLLDVGVVSPTAPARLYARMIFVGSPIGYPPQVSFTGKLGADGRGFLKFFAEVISPSATTTGPSLRALGKLALFVSASRGFATGGVLGEDGTEVTFRAFALPSVEPGPLPAN